MSHSRNLLAFLLALCARDCHRVQRVRSHSIAIAIERLRTEVEGDGCGDGPSSIAARAWDFDGSSCAARSAWQPSPCRPGRKCWKRRAASTRPADRAPAPSATISRRRSAVLKTPHGVKGDAHTPFAAHGCESCHGPSAAHAADEDVPVAVGFGDAFPTEPQNAVCLTCHRGGERLLWNGSVHDARGLACASCHDIHKARDVLFEKDLRPDALVRKDVSAACYGCHPTCARKRIGSRRIRSRKARSPATIATTCTVRRRSTCSSSAP